MGKFSANFVQSWIFSPSLKNGLKKLFKTNCKDNDLLKVHERHQT